MMVISLQLPFQSPRLDGVSSKSASMDSETVPSLSFGEILKVKEKQLQQEQEVSASSVAAALATLQTLSMTTPGAIPEMDARDMPANLDSQSGTEMVSVRSSLSTSKDGVSQVTAAMIGITDQPKSLASEQTSPDEISTNSAEAPTLDTQSILVADPRSSLSQPMEKVAAQPLHKGIGNQTPKTVVTPELETMTIPVAQEQPLSDSLLGLAATQAGGFVTTSRVVELPANAVALDTASTTIPATAEQAGEEAVQPNLPTSVDSEPSAQSLPNHPVHLQVESRENTTFDRETSEEAIDNASATTQSALTETNEQNTTTEVAPSRTLWTEIFASVGERPVPVEIKTSQDTQPLAPEPVEQPVNADVLKEKTVNPAADEAPIPYRPDQLATNQMSTSTSSRHAVQISEETSVHDSLAEQDQTSVPSVNVAGYGSSQGLQEPISTPLPAIEMLNAMPVEYADESDTPDLGMNSVVSETIEHLVTVDAPIVGVSKSETVFSSVAQSTMTRNEVQSTAVRAEDVTISSRQAQPVQDEAERKSLPFTASQTGNATRTSISNDLPSNATPVQYTDRPFVENDGTDHYVPDKELTPSDTIPAGAKEPMFDGETSASEMPFSLTATDIENVFVNSQVVQREIPVTNSDASTIIPAQIEIPLRDYPAEANEVGATTDESTPTNSQFSTPAVHDPEVPTIESQQSEVSALKIEGPAQEFAATETQQPDQAQRTETPEASQPLFSKMNSRDGVQGMSEAESDLPLTNGELQDGQPALAENDPAISLAIQATEVEKDLHTGSSTEANNQPVSIHADTKIAVTADSTTLEEIPVHSDQSERLRETPILSEKLSEGEQPSVESDTDQKKPVVSQTVELGNFADVGEESITTALSSDPLTTGSTQKSLAETDTDGRTDSPVSNLETAPKIEVQPEMVLSNEHVVSGKSTTELPNNGGRDIDVHEISLLQSSVRQTENTSFQAISEEVPDSDQEQTSVTNPKITFASESLDPTKRNTPLVSGPTAEAKKPELQTTSSDSFTRNPGAETGAVNHLNTPASLQVQASSDSLEVAISSEGDEPEFELPANTTQPRVDSSPARTSQVMHEVLSNPSRIVSEDRTTDGPMGKPQSVTASQEQPVHSSGPAADAVKTYVSQEQPRVETNVDTSKLNLTTSDDLAQPATEAATDMKTETAVKSDFDKVASRPQDVSDTETSVELDQPVTNFVVETDAQEVTIQLKATTSQVERQIPSAEYPQNVIESAVSELSSSNVENTNVPQTTDLRPAAQGSVEILRSKMESSVIGGEVWDPQSSDEINPSYTHISASSEKVITSQNTTELPVTKPVDVEPKINIETEASLYQESTGTQVVDSQSPENEVAMNFEINTSDEPNVTRDQPTSLQDVLPAASAEISQNTPLPQALPNQTAPIAEPGYIKPQATSSEVAETAPSIFVASGEEDRANEVKAKVERPMAQPVSRKDTPETSGTGTESVKFIDESSQVKMAKESLNANSSKVVSIPVPTVSAEKIDKGNTPRVLATDPTLVGPGVNPEQNKAVPENETERLANKVTFSSTSRLETPVTPQPGISTKIETDKQTLKNKSTVSNDEEALPTEKQPKPEHVSPVATPTTDPIKGAMAAEVIRPAQQLNTQAAEIAQQVIHQMNVKIKNGPSSMHLQLNPKELGAIDVEMVSTSQGVQVTFFAEQSNTGKLLETQLNQLRESLVDSGVQLSSLNISQQGFSEQKGDAYRQDTTFTPFSQSDSPKSETSSNAAVSPGRVTGQSSEVDYLI